ncbi:ABC transporter permease [Luteococcus sp. Sow4_B9]|uniref:ABC transporter permease n=1 Tax=Luteococcus sp. Sow4_B9 TaxID=3438792 RepID=UPI003F946029
MSSARRPAETAPRLPHQPPRRSADPPELRPVSGRPPLAIYLRQLWERRHFITERAWSLAVTQNKGMLLGNLWLLLNPLMDAAVYLVVFGFLFASNIPNFPAFLLIGIFMFGITSRDVNGASGIIKSNSGLIRAFSFPRASLVLASVLRNLLESVPNILVLFVLATIFVGAPGPSALLFPLLFALQVMMNTGFAFVAARLCSDIPDAQKLVPTIFRFLMYGSGVMFSIQRYEAIPWLAMLVRNNPLYLLIDGYRQLLLTKVVPPPGQWFELTLWAVAALVIGLVWFWRGEVTYGRPD